MLTLTVNLENEQLLNTSLQKMFESLTEEDIKEVAKQALLKYLTDIVDYDKERYKFEYLEYVKKYGITSSEYSYYNITKEKIESMTDQQIFNSDGFKQMMRKYKSPKESKFEQINELIKSELKTQALKYIQDNKDIDELMSNQKEIIKQDFPVLVSDVMSRVAFDFIMTTIENAKNGNHTQYAISQINERLNRNNLG